MDLGSTPGGASIIQKKPVLVAGFFVSGVLFFICLSALFKHSAFTFTFTLFSTTRFCL
ncbi:hypothetical protein VCHA37P192_400001 [Vibrio chagasii]|nr:hypothetical protein VCHA37P192_400001 [Vibrio chagasii]